MEVMVFSEVIVFFLYKSVLLRRYKVYILPFENDKIKDELEKLIITYYGKSLPSKPAKLQKKQCGGVYF